MIGEFYEIDPLTGAQTTIDGPSGGGGEGERERRAKARARLNRRRAGAIREIGQRTLALEPTDVDARRAAIAGTSREFGLPFVDPERLGIDFDEDGLWGTRFLKALPGGAEAQPFLDADRGVVYKLFDLRTGGGLGKKLAVSRAASPEDWEIEVADANLFETIEKLIVLDECGAHPTEIVGLLLTGDHLVVKQPAAEHVPIGPAERARAAGKLGSVLVPSTSIRGELRIIWHSENARPWLLGDLHPGNLMRDADGEMTIIDALIGSIPGELTAENPVIAAAVREARSRASGPDEGQAELF